jgi:hypothetical protein
MTLPLVTFGIINCNRLYYLKSCVSSLLKTTETYPNKQFIIVDNASIEPGTDEYLGELGRMGMQVYKADERDPANEFAKGLNLVVGEAQGKYICPLQGDMQFVLEGNWLEHYVKFYEENYDKVGCILFDAQRRVTNSAQAPLRVVGSQDYPFVFNQYRPPVAGAADVMFSKDILGMIGPWSEENKAHEGGSDSETDMLHRVEKMMKEGNLDLTCAMPVIPPAAAIYTDPRGTNARVRGNRRYGAYWPPKVDYRYYEFLSLEGIRSTHPDRNVPYSIEEMAIPLGWKAPIDENGNWMKNPIRPESAMPFEYEDLVVTSYEEYDYINDWLEEK